MALEGIPKQRSKMVVVHLAFPEQADVGSISLTKEDPKYLREFVAPFTQI
jgi:hypothetical protein